MFVVMLGEPRDDCGGGVREPCVDCMIVGARELRVDCGGEEAFC